MIEMSAILSLAAKAASGSDCLAAQDPLVDYVAQRFNITFARIFWIRVFEDWCYVLEIGSPVLFVAA